MNITGGKQNLLKLWLYSFSVAGRAFVRLLVLAILFVLGMVVVVTLLRGAGVLANLIMLPLMMQANAGAAITSIILIALAVWICVQIYTSFFMTAGIRSIEDVALNKKLSLGDILVDSFKPAFFLFVAGLLIGLISLPVSFISHKSPLLGGILNIILLFAVYVRLVYVQGFIALEKTGPIDGIVNSWNLTGKNYVDSLLLVLLIALTAFAYMLVAVMGAVALYKGIPLYFANGFDITHLSIGWWVGGLLAALVAFFCMCQVTAFWVITFLNRAEDNFLDPQITQRMNNFVALPEFELPELHPNPAHAQQAETTLREQLPDDLQNLSIPQEQPAPLPQQAQPAAHVQATQPGDTMPTLDQGPVVQPKPAVKPSPAQPTPAQPAKAVQKPQTQENLKDFQISLSSINTSDEEELNLSEHLNQVYTPNAHDAVQQGDEDRMPTILFDDEMAQQLLEKSQRFAPQQKSEDQPKDDGTDSIKMSKF